VGAAALRCPAERKPGSSMPRKGSTPILQPDRISADVEHTITSVAFFDPKDSSGGKFLVLGGFNSSLAVVTDFNGKEKGEFNYRAALDVISASDVAAITTGPQKGAFSLVSPDDSEIVVFSIQ
jgi:hypothetical protein